MSSESTNPPAPPGAGAAPSPANPAPTGGAPPASPPAGEEYKGMTPAQFSARLAEATEAGKKALLKDLGYDKPEDAKAAATRLKEIEQSQMTAQQKLEARLAELEPQAKRAAELGQTVESYAKQEFERLPEPLKKHVQAVAGDDPAARLKAITSARDSGLYDALVQKPGHNAGNGEPPRPPNPSNTMAPSGPATPRPAGTLTAFQQWEAIKAKGQSIRAQQFYSQNRSAIEASRPK